ncbi:MAG TPA: GNAT family N-acetyltransferase [Terriglobales bacterium]|nr:GNAT family N-acetyltransferase [Terriglobales bacterium]
MTDASTALITHLDTPVHEFLRDGYVISTDRKKLDIDFIHHSLTHCPWSEGISRDKVERSIQNSFCFGVYEGNTQVGFGRVITDFVTFAYIGDFFIIGSHRGRGLGKWLISTILACPELAGLQRKCIVTAEAHGLYREMGFMSVQRPAAYLELINKDAYK